MTMRFRRGTTALSVLLCALAADPVSAQTLPTAVDDQYVVNVSTTLVVDAASGVLANDTGFSATTHRLEASDLRSQYGGAVAVNPDGGFSYTPPSGFRGLDSFSYTVRNAFGATSALVQIEASGNRVWFVDPAAPANGDGSRARPFNGLTAVNGFMGNSDVDAPGDIIFLRSGTYGSVAFDVEAGQQLVGEGSGLDLVGTSGDIPPGVRPLLTTSGILPAVEFFGAGGQVRGLQIANSQGRAIVASGVADVQLRDLVINLSDTSFSGIELSNTQGGQRIENVQISGALGVSGNALAISGNAGVLDIVGTSINVTSGGRALAINNNVGTVKFDAASSIVTAASRGILLRNSAASSTITLGNVQLQGGLGTEPLLWLLDNDVQSTIDFANGMQLSNTDTDGTALRANRGKLRIGGSSSFIEASDGEAIYLDGVELLSEATFARISSNGSPRTGIRFNAMVGTFGVRVTGDTVINQPTLYGVEIANNAAFPLKLARLEINGGQMGINLFSGRLTVSDATSSVTTSSGIGLRLISAALDAKFATVSSAGGTSGLFLDNVQGTLDIAGGSITSASDGTAVRINNSNVVFHYGGSLSKTSSGLLVHATSLAAAGSLHFSGTASALPPSSGLILGNNAGNVRFGTLDVGSASQRFAVTSITMSNNAGALDLGLVSIYSAGVPALNIAPSSVTPGLIRTAPGSVLDTTGPAAVLVVNPTSPVATARQPLDLHFARLDAPDDGEYGVYVGRGTGTLEVTGASRLGPKSVAAVSLGGTNLAASFKEVDVTGAFDGVHLMSFTGGSSFRILGDGSTGTHTDGAGGTFSNVLDNAFQFVDAQNVVIDDVEISGTGGHAITALQLDNAEFANVDVTGAGNADNEHAYDFGEGSSGGAAAIGTLWIHDGEIRQFAKHGIFLRNWSGNLALKIDDNHIADNLADTSCGPFNCNGNGIVVSANGTAQIVARVNGNVLDDIDQFGIYGEVGGNLVAQLDLTVSDNDLTAHPYSGVFAADHGASGLRLYAGGGNARLRAAANGNTFRNFTGAPSGSVTGVVEMRAEGNSNTTDLILTANRVEHAHDGVAYRAFNSGAGVLRMQLDNNEAPPTGSLRGSAFLMRGNFSGPGQYVALLRGNQFAGVPSTPNEDTAHLFVTDAQSACAEITGNTIAAPSSGAGRSLLYSQTGPAPITLQGMGGNGTTAGINYLQANNTLGGAPFVANNVSPGTCGTPIPPAVVP